MSEDKKLAEKLTRVYLKIRNKKAQLSSDYKKQEDDLNQKLDKVKAALLDYCKEPCTNLLWSMTYLSFWKSG